VPSDLSSTRRPVDDLPWPSLVAMFFAQADRFADRPMLWSKRNGAYQPLTWRTVAAEVCRLAAGLQALGVGRGDRVGIVAENRPEWCIADLAIMAAGGVSVPAYTTNTEADHFFILNHSGARGVILSAAKLAARVLPAAERAENVAFALVMDEPLPPSIGRVAVHGWKQVLATVGAPPGLPAAAAALKPDDLACLIYTSGTGGTPKGVMLHHGAILHNCAGAAKVLDALGGDDQVFLSFLPLSHAYEHTVGQFLPIAIGGQIYYAEGVEKVLSNFQEARPTFVSAVPRFYEMVRQRTLQGVRKAGGLRERLFIEAVKLGRARYRHPDGLSLWQRLKDAVLERLVREKVRARFGGRVRAMVSGGAPLNLEVGIFLRALGLPVYQGYGQTEAAPLISVNHPARWNKLDTVGEPIPGVEVMIAGDGEILVRGGMVMQGYWHNDEASREVLRDGWLHTGDVGEIDADGDIRITDRKKDLIVNSGGDNISPARVEGLLTLRPEIAQAMVYGDRRPHLVALLVPDAEWLAAWAREAGKPARLAEVAGDPALAQALSSVVDEVNRELSVLERVRRFKVAPEPFTVDNEQMTPTLKVRRHVLRKIYGADLERLYE
jgi:long-chain acyl-CoA synthetase